MQLDDLRRFFGGGIREVSGRRWLDTRVGGLRTFIICRARNGGGTTFDLAVFTPHTRELDPCRATDDPWRATDERQEWSLEGEHVVPRLRSGFQFAGCRRGILFAVNTSEP